MPVIDPQQPVCTVIVTVDASADVIEDLVPHARLGVEQLFGECTGYVGGALHLSDDGRRLVQYLRWESESAYEACRDDPKWDVLPSTRRFMDHVAARRATVDARIYMIVAAGGR